MKCGRGCGTNENLISAVLNSVIPENGGMCLSGFSPIWQKCHFWQEPTSQTTPNQHFRKTKCSDMCRDDGMAMFNNKLFNDDTFKWRTTFQNLANWLVEGNCPNAASVCG